MSASVLRAHRRQELELLRGPPTRKPRLQRGHSRRPQLRGAGGLRECTKGPGGQGLQENRQAAEGLPCMTASPQSWTSRGLQRRMDCWAWTGAWPPPLPRGPPRPQMEAWGPLVHRQPREPHPGQADTSAGGAKASRHISPEQWRWAQAGLTPPRPEGCPWGPCTPAAAGQVCWGPAAVASARSERGRQRTPDLLPLGLRKGPGSHRVWPGAGSRPPRHSTPMRATWNRRGSSA